MSEPEALLAMPGHLIRRLQQHATAVFQEAVRAAGQEVTPVQFAALEALAAGGGLDQAGLARRIALDRATTGGVVRRLEAKGMVTRAPDPGDRRAVRLELTARGRAWLAALRPVVAAAQEAMLARLSPPERARLLALARAALEAD